MLPVRQAESVRNEIELHSSCSKAQDKFVLQVKESILY